ncbi:hypothetical protein [Streptomyces sp. NPDC050548]|uniref:hypothetical protein n=1 Tax=Streptomyces sp. NPDC050548 TaxID=3365629 RepID=UPI0037B06F86
MGLCNDLTAASADDGCGGWVVGEVGDPAECDVESVDNPAPLSDPTGLEIGSRTGCQYDLSDCSEKVQKDVGYDRSTGKADPSKGTAATSSDGKTSSGGNGAKSGDSTGCGSWGFLATELECVMSAAWIR